MATGPGQMVFLVVAVHLDIAIYCSGVGVKVMGSHQKYSSKTQILNTQFK